jgi:Na+-translocating ferredoxin:NAD+ oxidoreductase RnfG subunit
MNRSFILIIPFLLGCSPNSSGLKIEKKIQAYIAQNFEQYESIHQILIEEIEQGKKKFLYATMGQLYREYKVDNLIVFNEDNTKLFTTVNTIKDDGSSGSSDKIQSLYGVKIDGRWYVYLGRIW